MTDRQPTNRPTDGWIDGLIGKFHFQKWVYEPLNICLSSAARFFHALSLSLFHLSSSLSIFATLGLMFIKVIFNYFSFLLYNCIFDCKENYIHYFRSVVVALNIMPRIVYLRTFSKCTRAEFKMFLMGRNRVMFLFTYFSQHSILNNYMHLWEKLSWEKEEKEQDSKLINVSVL